MATDLRLPVQGASLPDGEDAGPGVDSEQPGRVGGQAVGEVSAHALPWVTQTYTQKEN